MLIVNFSPFPVLVTPRLVLRQISVADGAAIFSLRSNHQVMEFLDRPLLQTEQEGQEMAQKIVDSLAKNEGITWAITVKNESTLVGTIGYWRIMKEHFRGEIGYMLQPGYQGKGLMQEAMTAVLDHGFTQMGLHSIEANVNPNNIPSVKLLEKNQFAREAYHKENYYFNGRFLDSAIYSLLTPLRQD